MQKFLDRIKDLEKKYHDFETKVLEINDKLIELTKVLGIVKPFVDVINKAF